MVNFLHFFEEIFGYVIFLLYLRGGKRNKSYDKGRNHQQHQECGYNHGEKQHGLLGELVQSLLRDQNDIPDGGNREYERERAEQPGEIG